MSDEARMSVYHLINLLSYDKAIREKYLNSQIGNDDKQYNYQNEKVDINGTQSYLFWGQIIRKSASWTNTIYSITKKDLTIENTTASAVLIIPDEDDSGNETDSISINKSAWAITFGMGFQMIDPDYIDPDFGKRIAIRCASSGELNTISKTTLDDSPQTIRSTIPSGGSISRFNYEQFGDFITKIGTNGIINGVNNDEAIKIRGADSLSIPISKSPKEFLANLAAIKKMLQKEPRPELAPLEHLSRVKNKETEKQLNNILFNAIGKADSHIAISYPESIIDEFGQAEAFKIEGVPGAQIKDSLPSIDDLLSPLANISPEERAKKIKRLSVILYKSADSTDIASPKIPLKQWLSFEAELENNKRFYLQNNRWYSADEEYMQTIKKQVEEIFNRKSPYSNFIDWPIYKIPEDEEIEKKLNAELQYNRALAKQLNGLCLDQKLIYPDGRAGIEACDVLLKDGTFIHVKHISSSAPASHLLSQALVSAQLLTNDKNTRSLLTKTIEKTGNNPNDYELTPRRVVIVMARDNKPITPQSLFAFTKINLVRHDQQLGRMNVTLNVIPIVRKQQLSGPYYNEFHSK